MAGSDMVVSSVWQISLAVIASLGGGTVIVLACSAWLGKVWAERLMQANKAKHEQDLQKLRSELERQAGKDLAHLRADLDVASAKRVRDAHDKTLIYRLVVDIVADLLGDFDLAERQEGGLKDGGERFDRFNRSRMRAYGYMAMLAPQNVMDAFDALIDHLLLIAHGQSNYEWHEVRALAIAMINEIRKDVGVDQSAIEYNGKL